MTRHTIVVNADDIKRGIPCAPCKCPVSLAMSRTLGQLVSVGDKTWGFFAGRTLSHPLPFIARLAIDRYDDSGEMEPFGFTIEVP